MWPLALLPVVSSASSYSPLLALPSGNAQVHLVTILKDNVKHLKKTRKLFPFSVSLFQVTVVFDERAAMVFIALEVEGRSTKEALAIQVRILECH